VGYFVLKARCGDRWSLSGQVLVQLEQIDYAACVGDDVIDELFVHTLLCQPL
jgi:hypothetical protein